MTSTTDKPNGAGPPDLKLVQPKPDDRDPPLGPPDPEHLLDIDCTDICAIEVHDLWALILANYNHPVLWPIVWRLGYVKGNVEIISLRAAMIKGDRTSAELVAMAEGGKSIFSKEEILVVAKRLATPERRAFVV